MKDISLDTYDVVLAVSLAGGFLTGNWLPAIILFWIKVWTDWIEITNNPAITSKEDK